MWELAILILIKGFTSLKSESVCFLEGKIYTAVTTGNKFVPLKLLLNETFQPKFVSITQLASEFTFVIIHLLGFNINRRKDLEQASDTIVV